MKKIFLAAVIFLFISLGVMPTNAAEQLKDDILTDIIQQINAYRAQFKLPPVQPNDETCDFANIRAKEISINLSHDGFNQRQKAGTLPYRHWTVITENIAMNSDHTQIVNMWIHSPGHAKNMRADTPYVCVGQYGDYFAYLGMKP